MTPEFERESLREWKQTALKLGRTWIAPDVILLERDGHRAVLKDVRARPLLTRRLWCRGALRREINAMTRLRGMPGVPAILGRVDDDAFVMQWIDGRPLPPRRLREELGTAFFDELQVVIREMHGRGVAHGDLRRRNILSTADGHPCLIDFETALADGPGIVRRWAFRFLTRVDEWTVLKIFGRYYPHALDEQEREQLARAPWLLRIGRFLRKRVYHPLSPKIMKPRLRRLWRALAGKKAD